MLWTTRSAPAASSGLGGEAAALDRGATDRAQRTACYRPIPSFADFHTLERIRRTIVTPALCIER